MPSRCVKSITDTLIDQRLQEHGRGEHGTNGIGPMLDVERCLAHLLCLQHFAEPGMMPRRPEVLACNVASSCDAKSLGGDRPFLCHTEMLRPEAPRFKRLRWRPEGLPRRWRSCPPWASRLADHAGVARRGPRSRSTGCTAHR